MLLIYLTGILLAICYALLLSPHPLSHQSAARHLAHGALPDTPGKNYFSGRASKTASVSSARHLL